MSELLPPHPANDKVQCLTCRFWVMSRLGGMVGECRRYPPQVIPGTDPSLGDVLIHTPTRYAWPLMNEAAWCGEWTYQP